MSSGSGALWISCGHGLWSRLCCWARCKLPVMLFLCLGRLQCLPRRFWYLIRVTLQCSPHSGTIRVSSLATYDYKAYRNIGFCQSLWVIQLTLPEFSLRLTRSREICLKFANGSKAIRGPKTAASHRPCLVCKSNENHLQGINIIITAAQRTLTT